MTKIYCADVACVYNDEGVCKAKRVALSWHSVVTVNEGRQEFNRCKTREPSERARLFEQFFRERQKGAGRE